MGPPHFKANEREVDLSGHQPRGRDACEGHKHPGLRDTNKFGEEEAKVQRTPHPTPRPKTHQPTWLTVNLTLGCLIDFLLPRGGEGFAQKVDSSKKFFLVRQCTDTRTISTNRGSVRQAALANRGSA